jgi:hypothetical protein
LCLFAEFLVRQGEGPKQGLDCHVGEKERYDTDLDKNKDDAEIIGWIIPDNSEIATDEVNHLFDDDGQLSVNEILNNHDLFVGSEATDYGEHLHDSHR